jgi:hypothetical protein
MAMTIYKLYANASGDSVASLDVQLDGEIMALHMSAQAIGVNAADEGVTAELSFLSTNTFNANDVRGSLMIVSVVSGMLTSGMGKMADNSQISSLEIPLNAGERIHLHVLDIGTLTGRSCQAYLYVRDKGVSRTPGRRR